jgi:hypothetical protein
VQGCREVPTNLRARVRGDPRTILTTFVTLVTRVSCGFLYSFEDVWVYPERHHPYACWGAQMLVGGRRSAPQVPRGNPSVSTLQTTTFITS